VGDISGGSGGTLNLSVSTPGVELTVDRFGQFDPKAGFATVTGTFTCPSGLLGYISGELSQRANDRVAGQEIRAVPCNGAAQQWFMVFTPGLDGGFRGGPADVMMGIGVIGFPGGGGAIAETVNQRVILRG
jgi:hypothetical protein